MFYQIFLSPEVQQWALVTFKYIYIYIRFASRVAERLKTSGFRKLGNVRKLSNLHGMTV